MAAALLTAYGADALEGYGSSATACSTGDGGTQLDGGSGIYLASMQIEGTEYGFFFASNDTGAINSFYGDDPPTNTSHSFAAGDFVYVTAQTLTTAIGTISTLTAGWYEIVLIDGWAYGIYYNASEDVLAQPTACASEGTFGFGSGTFTGDVSGTIYTYPDKSPLTTTQYSVWRTEGSGSAVTASISLSGTTTAVEDKDYEVSTYPGTFPLELEWDAEEDGPKYFYIRFIPNSEYTSSMFVPYISAVDSGAIGTASFSRAYIINPGTISFREEAGYDAPEISIVEGDSTEIFVDRTSGTFGQVTASLVLAGTAISGTDYTISNLDPSNDVIFSAPWSPTSSLFGYESGSINLWLEADDINADDGATQPALNTFVATWSDKSGFGNDYVAPASENQPQLQDSGGIDNPSRDLYQVAFDKEVTSLCDYLSASSGPDLSQTTGDSWTLFVVYKTTGSADDRTAITSQAEQWFLGPYNGYAAYYNYGWMSETDYEIESDEYVVATVTNAYTGAMSNPLTNYWVNGYQYVTEISSAGSPGMFNLGADGYMGQNPLDGNIAEVLVYDTKLETDAREKVEGYLAAKWSFASLLKPDHPYYDSPAPITDYGANTTGSHSFVIETINNGTYEPAKTIEISFLEPLEYPLSGSRLYPSATFDGGYSTFTVTVEEISPNPSGTVNWSSESTGTNYIAAMGSEGSTTVMFGVDRSIVPSATLSGALNVTIGQIGDAVAGIDYIDPGFPLTLSWSDEEGGEKSFAVEFAANSAYTGTTFYPEITDGGGADIGTSSISVNNIIHPGTFNFNITASTIWEGQSKSLIFERTEGTYGDVTASVTLGGDAPSGTVPGGYTIHNLPISNQATMSSGQSSYTIRIDSVEDTTDEDDRYLTIELASLSYPTSLLRWSPEPILGDDTTFRLNILDNESGSADFDYATYTGKQNSSIAIAVGRSGGGDFTASVTVDRSGGGTAVLGTDYTGLPATLEWADQEEGVKYFNITTINSWQEGDKTIDLSFSALENIEPGDIDECEITITSILVEPTADAYPLVSPDGTINNYRNALTSRKLAASGVLPYGFGIHTPFAIRGQTSAYSGSSGAQKMQLKPLTFQKIQV